MDKRLWAVPAGAAVVGLSVLNYRRFMLPPIALGDERYPVDIRKMPLAADGRHIYGELLLPKGKTGPLPAVICCHGYGSSCRLTREAMGKSLAMSGYAAYCFDFCGGSRRTRSSGSMHDMTIFKEREDLLAVIDFVKKLEFVDPERLYLIGESQGGMVAGITAPLRQDDIRAMVLYYPAFCIPEDARKKFASREEIPDEVEAFNIRIGGEYYRSTYDFDPFAEIAGYTKPVLILHGDKDTVVDVSYGRRGAAACADARFEIFPGEIHGFYGKGKRKAIQMAYSFFEENKNV